MTAHLIAEDGLLQGLVLELTDGNEWILGRSKESADLVVDDSTVSRAHAKIIKTNEGFVLQNLSKVNPSRVNDEEHKAPILLKEGDKILIGETTFIFSEEEIPNQKKDSKKESKSQYDDIFAELNSPEEESYTDSPSEFQETIQSKDVKSDDQELSYDTILEDSQEESPVPFSMPGETPYLLKVIAGPNSGAEIGIEKGHSYVLGKDPQACDILFQDLSVSRSHARLTISEDGLIELVDLGSKNGTAVNSVHIQEKQIITPQDLISLGTTIFLIIDREAPQETIYAEIPSQTPQKEEVKTETPKEEPQEPKNWKLQPIPIKHLIIAGSIAAIFLISFSTFFSLFKSRTIEIVEKDPTSQVKDSLEADKFASVQYSFNPASGKLFLSGHVLTAVDYQEMRYNLSLLNFITTVEDSVVIDDGVCKMMNEILSQNSEWNSISVKCPSAGKFALVGYLQTSDEMNALSEFVNLNFPYLDRLEKKVAVEDVLQVEIASLLNSKGFGAVSFNLNSGSIVLSGVYDEKTTNSFKKVVEEIEKIPSIYMVNNFAVPTSPLLAAVNLSQDYTVSGITQKDGKGINAIINGKLYSLGDIVDQMKITKIENSTILLEKEHIKYRIDFVR